MHQIHSDKHDIRKKDQLTFHCLFLWIYERIDIMSLYCGFTKFKVLKDRNSQHQDISKTKKHEQSGRSITHRWKKYHTLQLVGS
jgi:hypothetical protein